MQQFWINTAEIDGFNLDVLVSANSKAEALALWRAFWLADCEPDERDDVAERLDACQPVVLVVPPVATTPTVHSLERLDN